MNPIRRRKLSGWDGTSATCVVDRPGRLSDLRAAIENAAPEKTATPRGGGMAYGDAALNADGSVIDMTRFDRFVAFDREAGVLVCEAGVTLEAILAVAIPAGWFPMVTPGTARATVGGCIACDVHGKNLHAVGPFSASVRRLTVMTADGRLMTCSREAEADVFWATVGGMGLTGPIVEAELSLQPIASSSIRQRIVRTRSLGETLAAMSETDGAPYRVAWIDGTAPVAQLGRGFVIEGHHADAPGPLDSPAFRRMTGPLATPVSLMNRFSVALANAAIYRRNAARAGAWTEAGIAEFFYPVDLIDGYRRLYGPKGLIEYQVALPSDPAGETIERLLAMLAERRAAVFLASLKQSRAVGGGPLSFPLDGVVFSFDLPRNDASRRLLSEMDDIVLAAGGRCYLAKDSRLAPEALRAMYPRLAEWRRTLDRIDPSGVFSSALARRTGLAGVP